MGSSGASTTMTLSSIRSSRHFERWRHRRPQIPMKSASVPKLDIPNWDFKPRDLEVPNWNLKFLPPPAVPHPLRRPPQPLGEQLREHAMEDRERARRALEARGIELERRRRLRG